MEKVGIVVVLMLFPMAMATAEGLKEAEEWFHEYNNTSTSVAQQKVTQLHFYLHDLMGVNKALVAQPNTTDASPATSFGVLYAIDCPLTVGPSEESKLIGRAQGIYCKTSMDKRSITMAMALVFTNGPFNGSSLSVLGDNAFMLPKREMPVVGGSGSFRLARGFALVNNYFFDQYSGASATTEYNMMVYHN